MAVTPLTVLISNEASATLVTAKKLYSVVGVSNAAYPFSESQYSVSGATGYFECWSGNTSGAESSSGTLPAPTGHGFLWDVTSLEGQDLLAGNYTPTFRLTSLTSTGTPGGTQTADLIVRVSKRSSGGVYTTIATSTLTSQSLIGTATTFTFSVASGAQTSFVSGDKLYLDIWVHPTVNTGGWGVRLNRLSTDTTGHTGDPYAQLVTPGYQPSAGGGGGTNTITRAITSVSAAVVGGASQLRAFYRVNEASGLTATDSSGNGYNGTYNGAITYNVAGAIQQDSSNHAITFGAGGYIALPSGVDPNAWTGLTFSCWFSIPLLSALDHEARLFANSQTELDHKGAQFFLANGGHGGTFLLGNGSSSASCSLPSGQDFVQGRWYHLACTWDGTQMATYIDGERKSTAAFSGPIASSSYPFNIGRNPAYADDYFPGSVDEIKFSNVAISPSEISTEYRNGVSRIVYTAMPSDMLLSWDKQYAWGNTAPWNNEAETYLLGNVFISGDDLVLEGRNTGGGDPSILSGRYTSGMVTSYSEMSYRYGYLEARIKMPSGYGVWPCFWTLYRYVSQSNEIDIVELFESGTSLGTAVHYPNTSGGMSSDGVSFPVAELSNDYHTYGFDWQADHITFFFDGLPLRRVTFLNELPTERMYVLLNLALGGVAVGNHIPLDSQFPIQMRVQWVRLWQGYDPSYLLAGTRLTYYGTSAPDTGGLGTASKMAPITGGSETSKTTVFVNQHVYGEIWSQGNASLSTVDAIPVTPTSRGWIFYPGAGTFEAGNWSAVATLSSALYSASAHTTVTMRFSKYSPGTGTFSAIGSFAVTITGTAKTTYTFPDTSMPGVTMAAGDGIYVELWWWDNNLYAINDNPVIYESSSGTNGVPNDLAITTSGFTPLASTSTRSLSSISAATQALGVARSIAGVSAATMSAGATTRTRPISGVSVSIHFGSPLSLYGTTLASTTLPSAKQALANINGASSAGYDTLLGTATGYSELYPTGTSAAWQALGALPGSATTHGYLLDSPFLEGQTILADWWTDTIRARINGGTDNATADFYTRVYKRSSAGVFTLIATLSLLGQTVLQGTSQNYGLTGSGASTAFATGDKLYFERFANVTGGVTSATAALRVDSSASTTLGSDNCVCSAPGLSTSVGGTKTRTLSGIGASVALVSHSDDFNRTIAGGLGTASDGDTYTLAGGIGGGTWSCQGGSYAQLTNTTNWMWAQHSGDTSLTNMDITFDFWCNYNAAGPGVMVFFHGGTPDIYHCYGAGYQNGTICILKWTSSSTNTVLASQSFGLTSSTWYSCRVQVRGGAISVRAWLRGNSEPSTWNATASDSSYASGSFGLAGYAGTAARVMSWDNLMVTSVSSTGGTGITRSITGISAAVEVSNVGGTPGILPGQVWNNGVSSYLFSMQDHGEPDMGVPYPTTGMINLTKALPGPTNRLMRTFFTNGATDTQINDRLRAIAACNGQPLICLQTCTDPTFNAHVVTMVGDGCLFYEFGNEPNATPPTGPMTITAYCNAWNAQIPNLRRINPAAKFIGPATTRNADSYMTQWLDACVTSGVIPDAVSFHSYPCTGITSSATCMTMTNIGDHIKLVQGYVKARWPNRQIAVGMTEWNVDSAFPMQPYANDEPFADNFYLAWLRSLISAKADFACHFALFGGSDVYNMINDGNGSTTTFYTAFKNAASILYVAPHARSISNVTAAVGGARGYSRTITGVSSALKALGVPRRCSPVTAATKAFGVPHRCFPVTASVGLISGTPVLAVAVSGMFVPVQQAGISFDQRLDDRAGGSFVTDDSTSAGIYPVQENQQVGISDSNSSLVLYRGFIDAINEGRLGNSSIVRREVTLKDLRALAEKRLCTQDYTGWTAGNIAAELVRTILAQEQIAATFAMRHDMDATTFGQGTLSGLTASDDGSLELAHAGTDIFDLDTETADFANGTLSGVTASGGALTLNSYTALKMAGQAGNNVGVNAGNYYTYWSIWQGSITINSGDYLEYSMWMSSSSADLVGGIDLQCSDKYCLKDAHWPDQYGIDSHPGVHMGGWADDQWLYRRIPMPPSMIGKTIKTARIALEADKEGSYCFYARNVRYKSSGGTTRATIFDTTLQRRSKISNVGYYNIVLKPVTVYEERGSRVAPALSLDGAGIAGQSLCSWSETLSTQTDSSSSSSSSDRPPQVSIETSMDGGDTWQTCTNNTAIPSLPVGMDLTNKSMLVKQTLCIAGPNPELPPVLNACSVSVEAAYASSKTDVSRSYSGPEMNDGTNSWCGYQAAINTADGWQRNDVSGLKMNGWRKNWRTGEVRNTQLYGTLRQQFGTYNGGLYVQCAANTGAHVHFSDAGSYSSLVVECDLRINTAGNVGILYNTTYWGNTNNSWGYYASISPTALELYRGSNANSSAFTTLWTLAATFDAGQYYHMKVVLGSDHIHHIYLDDIEYITWTDGTYTSGGVGVRMYSGGSDGIGLFDNFGVSANTQIANGVRTAPSVSLSGAGSVGDSHIWWAEDIPSGCTLDVSTSLDTGANYTSCTNGQAIPGLAKGDSLAGKSLLVKIILTSNSISYTPSLLGISWLVTGAFSASGNRVSPALLLSPAGTMIGSSSITWDADVPPSGTLGVDSSLNGTSWNVVNASGDPVTGLIEQGDCWWDSFDTDSSTSYSYTTGHWLWDIDNSRLVTQSTSDTLSLNGVSTSDAEIVIITDRLDSLQIILRSMASGHYDLQLNDDSASGGATLDFVKYTPGGGSVALRTEHSKAIPRGQYHTIRVTLIGGNYTVWLDGVQAYMGIDPSPLTGSGSCGLWFNAGTSYIRDLAIRPLGQDATGKNAYTRVRLSSTDPLTSPKVTDLVACVRSPLIATGVIIPQTKDWAGKQTVAGALDEIAKEANMSWRFNESFQLVMQPRDGQIAPFVLATVNGNIDAVSPPKVTRQSPAYRNRQTITGAVELVEQPESKLGNGVDTSWSLTYPIESITDIEINGQSQTFGIKDTDTGRLFYYTPGEKTLSLDTAQGPPTARIDITYIARKPYTAIKEDKAQQQILALLEGASGIYEASEDIGGLSSEAADALAQARLTENGRLAINWSCTTLESGLGPGQLLTVIVPEHGLDDLQFLLTSVSTQIRMQGDSTLFYWYDIEATTGPSLGSWSRTLTSRLLQKG